LVSVPVPESELASVSEPGMVSVSALARA
jgi:hypothetical protein